MKKGLLALLMGFCCAYSWGQTRTETDLSGPGWKMWLDKDAEWEKAALVDTNETVINDIHGQ